MPPPSERPASVAAVTFVDPLVIALEGPSYSGKSTLGVRLAETLGPDACLLPCYVDVAGGDANVPESRASSERAQLASLRSFVALDLLRSRDAREGLSEAAWVVADRCWLSLLAHVYAVAQTGGPDVYEAAEAALASGEGLLQPSVVLHLAVAEERRRERVPADRVDSWNADPAFNAELQEFFASRAPGLLSVPLHVVDADADAEAVHEQARGIIEAMRDERVAG